MGTTRRAQRRRFSSFPFVGPQDQTVNTRDRRRRALFAGTTKASPRHRLFTASHNGPSTEHGQVSLEHTRPRGSQICRKFSAKEWSLRVELYTEILPPPPAHLRHSEYRYGLGEQPFTRSHHSGELQNSSTATLHNQSHIRKQAVHSQFTNRSLPRTGYGKRSVGCSQVIGRREDYRPCGGDEGVQQRRGHRGFLAPHPPFSPRVRFAGWMRLEKPL